MTNCATNTAIAHFVTPSEAQAALRVLRQHASISVAMFEDVQPSLFGVLGTVLPSATTTSSTSTSTTDAPGATTSILPSSLSSSVMLSHGGEVDATVSVVDDANELSRHALAVARSALAHSTVNGTSWTDVASADFDVAAASLAAAAATTTTTRADAVYNAE